ncbi:MAG TPA: hypothetical protein VGH19_18195 [Verrucomicrobiae bacterium]
MRCFEFFGFLFLVGEKKGGENGWVLNFGASEVQIYENGTKDLFTEGLAGGFRMVNNLAGCGEMLGFIEGFSAF